jgi:hypothetical protein
MGASVTIPKPDNIELAGDVTGRFQTELSEVVGEPGPTVGAVADNRP